MAPRRGPRASPAATSAHAGSAASAVDLVGDGGDGEGQVGPPGDDDVDDRPGPLLGRVADHADLAVGHEPDGAVVGPDAGDPQVHLLDRAGDRSPTVMRSPTPYWSSARMKKPGHEVLHQALGAEAEGHADDAGAGQEGPEVEADLARHQQDGDGPDDDPEDAGGHAGRGWWPAARPGATARPAAVRVPSRVTVRTARRVPKRLTSMADQEDAGDLERALDQRLDGAGRGALQAQLVQGLADQVAALAVHRPASHRRRCARPGAG